MREYYAGVAMQAFLANKESLDYSEEMHEKIAVKAFRMADMMVCFSKMSKDDIKTYEDQIYFFERTRNPHPQG